MVLESVEVEQAEAQTRTNGNGIRHSQATRLYHLHRYSVQNVALPPSMHNSVSARMILYDSCSQMS